MSTLFAGGVAQALLALKLWAPFPGARGRLLTENSLSFFRSFLLLILLKF